MKIYIADNQDITRAGLLYIVSQRQDCESKLTSDKSSLIEALKEDSHVVIVLDYTLFDINDAAELCIISQQRTLMMQQRKPRFRVSSSSIARFL